MNNIDYTWDERFTDLFAKSLDKIKDNNNKDFSSYYDEDDLAFLKSIGYTSQEFFDYVEDFSDDQEPSISASILIAAVRRDYLLVIQKNKHSTKIQDVESFPSKDATYDAIEWLPRIVAKAEAKLRGELSDEMMYCCGGDRKFLSTHDIHPADFLRLTWAANGDIEKIASYVKESSSVL